MVFVLAFLHALHESESRIRSDFAELKGQITRVDGKLNTLQSTNTVQHQGLEHVMGLHERRLTKLENNEEETGKFRVEELQEEIKRRDEERRKWIFWGVTTLVGGILSGGALTAIVAKLLQ